VFIVVSWYLDLPKYTFNSAIWDLAVAWGMSHPSYVGVALVLAAAICILDLLFSI
jgi:hypothetical protein